MQGNAISLGTIRGIKIRLHWTWAIVFLLLTWSLAEGYFPQNFRSWSAAEYWLVAAAAAILLFVTVLIHELSHSLVARAQGLPVDSITLYLFGGVSNLTHEPESAGQEFVMAAAGPLASVVLGLIFLGLYASLVVPDWLSALFGYLGTINLILAFFNLVPAFPLDGGRILRSALWGFTKNARRATRSATRMSEGVAWVFILLGIWIAFTVDLVSGLWLALIGWFVFNAAVSYRTLSGPGPLAALHVADVMTSNPATIPPETRVDVAVQDYLLREDERALPVMGDGRLLGLLSVSDIRHFPPEQWSTVAVWRAMTPVDRLDTVPPDAPLTDAVRLMTEHRRNELPVVQDGQLVGLLSRGKVAHYLQVRRELGLREENVLAHLPGQDTAA